jgi:mannose-1-phosphate guanylyltransferase/mannose-6-phosphate isomerase
LFDRKPIIIGANDHRFLIAEDLNTLAIEADIILEPMQRNSCAAIVAGCLQALERDENAIVLVLAADHAINDQTGFEQTVQNAIQAAQQGHLITFGIKPDYPATGYGYILPSETMLDEGGNQVLSFVEKPDEALALQYMEEGYLWNSGNFMFRADCFLEEAGRHVPEVVEAVTKAHLKKKADLDFLRLDEKSFEASPSISVDYAIMEKTDKAVVFAASHDWSDIGTWNSVWRNLPKDEADNVMLGDVIVKDGSNNLVHSRDRLTTLLGVDDTIVVATRDVVFVGSQSESEAIKELVEKLKSEGRDEADTALQVYRPWGNYEQLDYGDGYQVKRIVIKPAGVLSLQKHKHRAEHWVVVQGTPEITIDDKVQTLKPNQSIYIPLGSVHRLANRTAEPVVIIEVQTGDYLGEDDIIRLEDDYNRNSKS